MLAKDVLLKLMPVPRWTADAPIKSDIYKYSEENDLSEGIEWQQDQAKQK